jgi:hypothetical protein
MSNRPTNSASASVKEHDVLHERWARPSGVDDLAAMIEQAALRLRPS